MNPTIYPPRKISPSVQFWLLFGVLFLGLMMCSSCGNRGNRGLRGPEGPLGVANPNPSPPVLTGLPGLNIAITGVSGGSLSSGNFQAGDYVSVTFSIKYDDGTDIPIGELGGSYILLAGPTSNYQRVLPSGRTNQYYLDVKASAVQNSDNTYTYTFPDPIPANYGPPLYDTTKFTSTDEWTNQPLVTGTYTVGLAAFKYYVIDNQFYTDVGNATREMLLGTGATLDSREVINQQSCNQCHLNLQSHDGIFRNYKMCLMCHTTGAEDKNSTDSGDGTNETIEFKVMIHKIHNGRHLPSVLGVSTNASGAREYYGTLNSTGSTPAPKAYKIGESDLSKAKDFSSVGFPVWPNQGYPMPKDDGYENLLPFSPPAGILFHVDKWVDAQKTEDEIRKGVTACGKCHGDPDGPGPLTKPIQGDYAYQKPTRKTCGSCHDDINWTNPYTANSQTMAPQANDLNCSNAGCHEESGTSLSVRDGHVHPLNNPAINPGMNIQLKSISGATLGGNFQVGDPITLRFAITDDSGTNINPFQPTNPVEKVSRMYVAVAGPTTNRQLLIHSLITENMLPAPNGSNEYIMNVPQQRNRYCLGKVVSGVNNFTVPGGIWEGTGLSVNVYELANSPATPTTTTTLVNPSTTNQNYLEVQDGSRFSPFYRFTLPLTPYQSELNNQQLSPGLMAAFTNHGDDLQLGINSTVKVIEQDNSWEIADVSYVYNIIRNNSDLNVYCYTKITNKFIYVGYGTSSEDWMKVSTVDVRSSPHLIYFKSPIAKSPPGCATADCHQSFTTGIYNEYPNWRAPTSPYRDCTKCHKGSNGSKNRSNPYFYPIALRYSHLSGTEVRLASEAVSNANYTLLDLNLDGKKETVQLTGGPGQFAIGSSVYISCISDFTIPPKYPTSMNATASVDETSGRWVGKSLVDGTYIVGLWSFRFKQVNKDGWANVYHIGTPPETTAGKSYQYFMVGPTATSVVENKISSSAKCNACHNMVLYHGGSRRGYENCLLCHGNAGIEDKPHYQRGFYEGPQGKIEPDKETPGVLVDFRTLMHKIHRGKNLSKASTYKVIGKDDLDSAKYFKNVGFPAMAGGVRRCSACHEGDTWKSPKNRDHPTEQTRGVRKWAMICGTCHDSDSAQGHIKTMSNSSGEMCQLCHNSSNVEQYHRKGYKK